MRTWINRSVVRPVRCNQMDKARGIATIKTREIATGVPQVESVEMAISVTSKPERTKGEKASEMALAIEFLDKCTPKRTEMFIKLCLAHILDIYQLALFPPVPAGGY